MTESNPPPRAAVFHDLSGLGRCALSVVMPTLAALGVSPCALPTALLSAHTAYERPVQTDETDYLAAGLSHWRMLGARFDGAYTGYLASPAQARLLTEALCDFESRGVPCRVVDPAMADHGRLYRAVSPDMPEAMRALCARATLITPNLTEACLLTDTPYPDAPLADAALAHLLDALRDLGCGAVLITGVPRARGAANVLATADGARLEIAYDVLPAAYPGTGDLLASVVTGGLLRGQTPENALRVATRFVRRAIENALRLGRPAREGVPFEPLLRTLPAEGEDWHEFDLEPEKPLSGL